jgi:hypothetical protein
MESDDFVNVGLSNPRCGFYAIGVKAIVTSNGVDVSFRFENRNVSAGSEANSDQIIKVCAGFDVDTGFTIKLYASFDTNSKIFITS